MTALGIGGSAAVLALQGTLSNLVGDFYLAAHRPVSAGDLIRLKEEDHIMRWIHAIRLGVLVGVSIVMTAGLGGPVRADEPAAAPAAKAADSDIRVTTAHVRDVQLILLAAGYDPGPIDGVMGPRTKSALRQYIAVPPPLVPSRPEWNLVPSRGGEPLEAQ